MQEDLVDSLLRYGLFFGAIFQLICIGAVIIMPDSSSQIEEYEEPNSDPLSSNPEDSEGECDDGISDDEPSLSETGTGSPQVSPTHKLLKLKKEKKKKK